MLCLVNFSCLSETKSKGLYFFCDIRSIGGWFFYHLMPANYLIPVLGKRQIFVSNFNMRSFLFIRGLFGCFNPFRGVFNYRTKYRELHSCINTKRVE